jgi:Tfp pilus assembly protein PilF
VDSIGGRNTNSKSKYKDFRDQHEKVAKVGTRNAEAYQLYLKGRYQASKSSAEGLQRAIEYFQQAIEKDPGDALAYAALANSYIDLGANTGYLPLSDLFPKAEAAATKALALDDSLAEAHAAIGSVKSVYEWDWSGSEREFEQAILLDPNNAHAHNRYARYLMFVGRFDETIAENKRAQELDPLSPEIARDLAYNYMVLQHYDDSILQ